MTNGDIMRQNVSDLFPLHTNPYKLSVATENKQIKIKTINEQKWQIGLYWLPRHFSTSYEGYKTKCIKANSLSFKFMSCLEHLVMQCINFLLHNVLSQESFGTPVEYLSSGATRYLTKIEFVHSIFVKYTVFHMIFISKVVFMLSMCVVFHIMMLLIRLWIQQYFWLHQNWIE